MDKKDGEIIIVYKDGLDEDNNKKKNQDLEQMNKETEEE